MGLCEETNSKSKILYILEGGHRYYYRWTTTSTEDKEKWKKIMMGDTKKKHEVGGTADPHVITMSHSEYEYNVGCHELSRVLCTQLNS